MRVLILSQWFSPEPSMGLLFAKGLSALGHDVEVLTGFPNYPEGKVYQGYRVRLFQRELMDGIPVTRVALYPSHDESNMHRIMNYVSFAISATFIGTLLVKEPDVVFVYHPPATVGMAALVMKWFRKTPFIFEVADLWPDEIEASGMLRNRFLFWLVDRWCRFVYKQAERVTVVSLGFKKKLVERGVPEDKIEVIYYWCDEESIKASETSKRNEVLLKELGLIGKFNVVYAGNIGKAQGLASVLEAAHIIEETHPEIRFIFVGSGVEADSLKSTSQQMALDNVLFLGRRNVDEIGEVLSIADVLLVHLKDEPFFRITIPSKMQAYMHVGKPILMAVRGEAAEIVEEAGAGITCIPGDADSIASAAERLYLMPKVQLEEMGRRGCDYYGRRMSQAVGIKRFEEVLTQAAKKKK